ncbi:unnamed protein product [Echinostoma caproni]|uniref:DUF2428 domain-containing protein n=1 Tax=Echinostoma caproni TaxID=27848 RepID=A0A3P8G6P0_9TREM|nr:unnamed protein product [Echinostoma caproni]
MVAADSIYYPRGKFTVDACDEKKTVPVGILITCEQVLDVCWKFLCQYTYSVTRRAAGLWPAVKAALLAERARGSRNMPNLLINWLRRLLRLASVNSNGVTCTACGEEKADSPRTLALHILRGMVADASLRAHIQLIPSADDDPNQSTYSFAVEAICQAVLPGFMSPEWTISNAALQLHSALVLRLTGSNSGRPAPSASVVFDVHKPLLEMCVDRLEWVQRSGQDSVWTTTQLLPLLTLLVRMAPSSGAKLFNWSVAFNLVEHLLIGPTVGPGTWFLASRLCDLMTVVISAAVDHSDWDSTLRSTAREWFVDKLSRFCSTPHDQPFYVDAVVALVHFVYHVCPSILVHNPIILVNWAPRLVHRLLGALTDTDRPQYLALFANTSVQYWLLGIHHPTTNMLLSWRVVQVWAFVIQNRLMQTGDIEVHLNDDQRHKAISSLRAILNVEDVGSSDAGNRANALLCEAVCLSVTDSSHSFYLDRWFDQLTDCLHPSSPDSARLIASEAVYAWLSSFQKAQTPEKSPSSVQQLLCTMTPLERQKFLSLLFLGIFDECAEGFLEGLPSPFRLIHPGLTAMYGKPVAPLFSVHLLLERLLPFLFSDRDSKEEVSGWLQAEWKRVMHGLNRRLIEEAMMRER